MTEGKTFLIINQVRPPIIVTTGEAGEFHSYETKIINGFRIDCDHMYVNP